jgi:DNA-binding ferritin-like protein (Dps family)
MDKPTGPGQWDAFMKKIFEGSGALNTKEGQAAVRKMQMSPTEYKATMKRLDDEIIRIEIAADRNAMDPFLKRRLEVLYQMKALSHVLEKSGVVPPPAAALPTFDQGVSSFSGDGPRLRSRSP